ncbi:hypothetical protein HPB51_020074 [Rhipicephalus microplus]|uniref:Peptidase M13 N-terminal domain-containing protein n=1 Tax=Rhipicephalus microplus TaxID=6941 RepID=A0A9J6EBK9_RHIMP|nr:hypothetical protein HPB51_020074 [Rhipicephalus microplus]
MTCLRIRQSTVHTVRLSPTHVFSQASQVNYFLAPVREGIRFVVTRSASRYEALQTLAQRLASPHASENGSDFADCAPGCAMHEEEDDVSTIDCNVDTTEQEEEDDQPEDFEPPTRNVLLRARPHVFAMFELLTLVVVVVYVYYNPKPWPWSLQLSCVSLECFNVQAELHSSMDLSAEPCDDFYQYVCGHWAEGHSRYQDQFRYLEVSMMPLFVGHALIM